MKKPYAIVAGETMMLVMAILSYISAGLYMLSGGEWFSRLALGLILFGFWYIGRCIQQVASHE